VQNYKFGVLYSPGNCTIEEILSITPGINPFSRIIFFFQFESYASDKVNPNFFAFMDFIGMRVKLKGWKGFCGDLDTKGMQMGDPNEFFCFITFCFLTLNLLLLFYLYFYLYYF
jgi:hypothetical protein